MHSSSSVCHTFWLHDAKKIWLLCSLQHLQTSSYCRTRNFMVMEFLLYLWLDSYHKNIIYEKIIAILYLCISHVASVRKNLIRKFFRQNTLQQCICKYFRPWKIPSLCYILWLRTNVVNTGGSDLYITFLSRFSLPTLISSTFVNNMGHCTL